MILLSAFTRYVPCNEEYFAFLDILICGEVEVIDRVAALVAREGGSKIIIALLGVPELLDRHPLVLDLEHDEPVVPLRFQLQKLQLTLVVHRHSRCSIRLPQKVAISETRNWK